MSKLTHAEGTNAADGTAKTATTAYDLQEPAFLDDDGTIQQDVPAHVHTANASALFDLRAGETVAQAAARKASEG